MTYFPKTLGSLMSGPYLARNNAETQKRMHRLKIKVYFYTGCLREELTSFTPRIFHFFMGKILLQVT